MKRILRYLKGQPKLGLWYPRDSPFDLEAFSGSDYASASLDRKSTTGDESVYKECEDRMERAAIIASSLDAECQVTILGVAEAQTWFKAASKHSNNLPLSSVNTLRSGEDIMKLKELMELCTKLSDIMIKNKRRDMCIKTERVICLRLILVIYLKAAKHKVSTAGIP
ncbi:hypothetical protein Tco_0581933 [Tanacetum coccineum]